jgi:hypothetical protein
VEKRYQVFVSSTFSDLQEERQEIIQALLELKCIPAGMELFPAANDDQWTLIKKVIQDCDYYIVIIAGRYGSVGPEGLSYTEMEYRYALEQGIPTIGFLHKNPSSIAQGLSESDPAKQVKLKDFCELVQKKVCRYWESPSDLGSKVSRSLINLINDTPAVGWVRADQITEADPGEMLRLRKRIDELEASIQASRETAPPGTQHLAQGDELFPISFSITTETPVKGEFFEQSEERIYLQNFDVSWNEIFSAVAPLMIDEATDVALHRGIEDFVVDRRAQSITDVCTKPQEAVTKIKVQDQNFQTIKVQLRALGLITKSQRQRSLRDKGTYWTLTPYGDEVMTRLRAIATSRGIT